MSDLKYQWGHREEPVILLGLPAAFQAASLHPSPAPLQSVFALSHPGYPCLPPHTCTRAHTRAHQFPARKINSLEGNTAPKLVQALWTGETACAGRTGAVSELEGAVLGWGSCGATCCGCRLALPRGITFWSFSFT